MKPSVACGLCSYFSSLFARARKSRCLRGVLVMPTIFLFLASCMAPNNESGPPTDLIKDQLNPLGANGGAHFLREVRCLALFELGPAKRNAFFASKTFLIRKGLSAPYFEKHFCPIQIVLENDGAYARVTYKGSFPPYTVWWQHHFPIVPGEAEIDASGKHYLVQDFEVKEFGALLNPRELNTAMRALIGEYKDPLRVDMGFEMGKRFKLIATGSNRNPKPLSCSDTEQIGAVDVETGAGSISFSGICK